MKIVNEIIDQYLLKTGGIRGIIFHCRFVTVDGSKTSVRIHSLKKYTTYFVWVSASTSVKEGPMSAKHAFTTAEDGTFRCIFNLLMQGSVNP